MGLKVQPEIKTSRTKAKLPDILDADLPGEFDWRTRNAVTPVKNQGNCGSCWAFAVTGNVEGQYAIKHGELLSLSEQELLDCDEYDHGCNGGDMQNAYRALEKLGGLELEGDYPYDAKVENCQLASDKIVVKVVSSTEVLGDEVDMAKWLYTNGPMAISINADAMQFYTGGVSYPWYFTCSPDDLNHGVIIVGYGEDTYGMSETSLPYWIIKNSWGTGWGEDGYYRVYRGAGVCGLDRDVTSAVVE